MVREIKITKKNIKRISKVVEMDLKKAVSIFSGSDGFKCAYETKREIEDCFAMIYITPTRKKHPYITSAVLTNVNEWFESSRWKQSIFYGIEICNSYDKFSKSYIPMPCITVHIKIEQDDEQQG